MASNKFLMGSRARCQFDRQPPLHPLELRPCVKRDQGDDVRGNSDTHQVPRRVESVETRVLGHRGVAHVVEPGRADPGSSASSDRDRSLAPAATPCT